MTEIPRVELSIRSIGESIHSAIMLHHADIESLVEQGVERAIATIGELIIEEAAKVAAYQPKMVPVWTSVGQYSAWVSEKILNTDV
jgi:hypothetical protein